MKTAVWISYVLSILVCAAWPFLAFGSIFAFDAPIKGPADEYGRYALVGGLLSYPWGYAIAIKRKKTERWVALSTCLLFLCPHVHLGLVLLLFFE